MSRIKATDKVYRGVYGFIRDNIVRYTGSSYCKLTTLENNHRNWKEKYGSSGWTNFRGNLVEDARNQDGVFVWLIKPALRTQKEIEELEKQVINLLDPEYNIDYDPVKSSINRGRYA
jgi:hypothetical protein